MLAFKSESEMYVIPIEKLCFQENLEIQDFQVNQPRCSPIPCLTPPLLNQAPDLSEVDLPRLRTQASWIPDFPMIEP